MKLKTFLSSVLILLSVAGAHSQSRSCLCDTLVDNPFKPQLRGQVFHWDKYINGSIYFYEEFVNGEILLSNGEWVYNKLIQYNGYSDELIQFEETSQKLIQLDKQFIQEFRFNDSQRNMSQIFRKTITKPDLFSDSVEVFVQVLHEDTISLFVWRKIKITGAVIEKSRETEVSVDKYTPVPVYFLKFADGSIISFNKIKRSAIISSFPGREREIKTLLRKNNLRLLKEEGQLKKFVTILNQSDFQYLTLYPANQQ